MARGLLLFPRRHLYVLSVMAYKKLNELQKSSTIMLKGCASKLKETKKETRGTRKGFKDIVDLKGLQRKHERC